MASLVDRLVHMRPIPPVWFQPMPQLDQESIYVGKCQWFVQTARSAEVFLTDNVTEYYEQNWTRKKVRMDDEVEAFPCCVPPYPLTFIETRTMRELREDIQHLKPRMGVLIATWQDPQDFVAMCGAASANRFLQSLCKRHAWVDYARNRDRKEFAMRLLSELPSEDEILAGNRERARHLVLAAQAATKDDWGGWLEEFRRAGLRWFSHFHICFGYSTMQFNVVANGTLLFNGQGDLVGCPDLGLELDGDVSDDHQIRYRAGLFADLFPVLAALSFLNCKNVVTTLSDPASDKKQRERHKHGLPPLIRFRTLNIVPMRELLHREGAGEGVCSLVRALHGCRGHFKDYRERGLFGRHRGVYWWEHHARGAADSGAIVKDYRILKPRQEQADVL